MFQKLDESSLFQQSRRKSFYVKNRNNSDGTLVRKNRTCISISLTNGGGLPRLHCGNRFLFCVIMKTDYLFVPVNDANSFRNWRPMNISTSIGMRVYHSLERHNRKSTLIWVLWFHSLHWLSVTSTWWTGRLNRYSDRTRADEFKNVTKVTWNHLPLRHVCNKAKISRGHARKQLIQ